MSTPDTTDDPTGTVDCFYPDHCKCGCGSHSTCVIYGEKLDEQSNLALVFSRAMNERIGMSELTHATQDSEA